MSRTAVPVVAGTVETAPPTLILLAVTMTAHRRRAQASSRGGPGARADSERHIMPLSRAPGHLQIILGRPLFIRVTSLRNLLELECTSNLQGHSA